MTLRIWSINSRNIQRNYVKLYRTNVRVVGREVRSVLTAEGRTPPNAVYKESFPTGIPIPWKNSNDRVKEVDCILNCENRERERERERDSEFIRLIYIIQIEIQNQKCHTWQPRSPSPNIRSPSVTTITWTVFSGQFFKTSKIFSLKGDNHSLSGSMLCRRL
jgi:hypothetical protein